MRTHGTDHAKNALARAVFLNRIGQIRDRSFENQRYRASGPNLVVAAIVLWNTIYIERRHTRCGIRVIPILHGFFVGSRAKATLLPKIYAEWVLNPASTALVLDLVDEIEALKSRLRRLGND